MTFGQLLKKARLQQSWGQDELANKLGVSKTYLSDIERGQRPPLNQGRIRVAAQLLGADERELLEAASINRGQAILRVVKAGAKAELAAYLVWLWSHIDDEVADKLHTAIKQLFQHR